MAQIANTVMTIPAFISNDAADDSITITDPISGVKTLVYATGYYEFVLNDGTGTGTRTDPWHALKLLAAATTANWLYSLGNDGRITIEYTGIGTATFVFATTHVRNLFGFTSSTLTFSGPSSQTATYPVFGVFLSKSRKGDSSWRHVPGHSVYQITPGRQVIGWNDGNDKQVRSFTFDFLPKDQNSKTSGMVSTPVYPVSASEWNTTPTALSYTPPYTALRFAKETQGELIKLYLGPIPYNGTSTYFNVYQTPDSIKKSKRFPPSIPGNETYLSYDEVEVLEYSSDSGEASYATGSIVVTNIPLIISDIYAWYKYDDLTQSGGAVSQVTDKSGNGRHAVMATSGSQPLYTASGGANNKAYWTGTDATSGGRYLEAGVASDWTFLHNGAGFTIFIVSKNASAAQNYIIGTQTGTGASLGISIARLNSSQELFGIGTAALPIVSMTYSRTQNAWSKLSLYGATGTDPDYCARVNGAAATTSTESSGPAAITSSQKLGIGSGGGGAYSSAVSFHEIIIYNRELTSTEIATIETYLNTIYGL